MNQQLRSDGERIEKAAIASVLLDEAVCKAVSDMTFPGRMILILR